MAQGDSDAANNSKGGEYLASGSGLGVDVLYRGAFFSEGKLALAQWQEGEAFDGLNGRQ